MNRDRPGIASSQLPANSNARRARKPLKAATPATMAAAGQARRPPMLASTMAARTATTTTTATTSTSTAKSTSGKHPTAVPASATPPLPSTRHRSSSTATQDGKSAAAVSSSSPQPLKLEGHTKKHALPSSTGSGAKSTATGAVAAAAAPAAAPPVNAKKRGSGPSPGSSSGLTTTTSSSGSAVPAATATAQSEHRSRSVSVTKKRPSKDGATGKGRFAGVKLPPLSHDGEPSTRSSSNETTGNTATTNIAVAIASANTMYNGSKVVSHNGSPARTLTPLQDSSILNNNYHPSSSGTSPPPGFTHPLPSTQPHPHRSFHNALNSNNTSCSSRKNSTHSSVATAHAGQLAGPPKRSNSLAPLSTPFSSHNVSASSSTPPAHEEVAQVTTACPSATREDDATNSPQPFTASRHTAAPHGSSKSTSHAPSASSSPPLPATATLAAPPSPARAAAAAHAAKEHPSLSAKRDIFAAAQTAGGSEALHTTAATGKTSQATTPSPSTHLFGTKNRIQQDENKTVGGGAGDDAVSEDVSAEDELNGEDEDTEVDDDTTTGSERTAHEAALDVDDSRGGDEVNDSTEDRHNATATTAKTTTTTATAAAVASEEDAGGEDAEGSEEVETDEECDDDDDDSTDEDTDTSVEDDEEAEEMEDATEEEEEASSDDADVSSEDETETDTEEDDSDEDDSLSSSSGAEEASGSSDDEEEVRPRRNASKKAAQLKKKKKNKNKQNVARGQGTAARHTASSSSKSRSAVGGGGAATGVKRHNGRPPKGSESKTISSHEVGHAKSSKKTKGKAGGEAPVRIRTKISREGDLNVKVVYAVRTRHCFNRFVKEIMTRFGFAKATDFDMYCIDATGDRVDIDIEEDFDQLLDAFEETMETYDGATPQQQQQQQSTDASGRSFVSLSDGASAEERRRGTSAFPAAPGPLRASRLQSLSGGSPASSLYDHHNAEGPHRTNTNNSSYMSGASLGGSPQQQQQQQQLQQKLQQHPSAPLPPRSPSPSSGLNATGSLMNGGSVMEDDGKSSASVLRLYVRYSNAYYVEHPRSPNAAASLYASPNPPNRLTDPTMSSFFANQLQQLSSLRPLSQEGWRSTDQMTGPLNGGTFNSSVRYGGGGGANTNTSTSDGSPFAHTLLRQGSRAMLSSGNGATAHFGTGFTNANGASMRSSHFANTGLEPPSPDTAMLADTQRSAFNGTFVVEEGELVEWRRMSVLGKGSFGTVYEGITLDGKMIAVKVQELPVDDDAAEIKALQTEINLMRSLKHRNIVAYYGCQTRVTATGGQQMEIFLELCHGGSLATLRRKLIKTQHDFGISLVRSYTRQIVEGLAYLHAEHVIHRDIKSDNVLISATGEAKLADFGCSKRFGGGTVQGAPTSATAAAAAGASSISNTTTAASQAPAAMYQTMVGSPFFMAPEVMREDEGGYTSAADIWSVGCLVIELLGREPWEVTGTNIFQIMFRIAREQGMPTGVPPNCPPMLYSFFERCFERDPAKRATAAELLEHEWMTCPDKLLEEVPVESQAK